MPGDALGVPVVLATGTPAGVYHRLGSALVALWRAEPGAAATLLESPPGPTEHKPPLDTQDHGMSEGAPDEGA